MYFIFRKGDAVLIGTAIHGMVDTKERTVFNDESEKAEETAEETARAAEEELKESIRLNTFRVYSLQEMQKQLQKELRRAIENGADEKTISVIQDEWNRNIRDYTQTVNRLKHDIDRMGEYGQEAFSRFRENDPFTKFRTKDVGKYIEARTRALRAAIGKMIKDLRAKNEQHESDLGKADGETAHTAKAKKKEFNASIKEMVNVYAAAYYNVVSKMIQTFEKHLDERIEEMKQDQQQWEQEKAKTQKEKDQTSEKDPVDLDQSQEDREPAQKNNEKRNERDRQEPDTEPQPEPQPEPVTDPEPQPEPEPVPQPEQESKPEQEPEPEQEPQPEPIPQSEPVNQPPVTDMPEPVNNPANPTPLNLEGLEEREDLGDAVSSKNTEEDAMQPKESAPLTPESLKRLQEMMMLNGLKDEAGKNGAEYTGKAEESAHAAKDAAKEAEQAKREAEKAAEQAKVDELHGLTLDDAEKKILASLREQEELGDSKQVIYQDFDRDGDGKMDTRFSIVPNSYQQWNYDNILKSLQERKANGEKTAGIDVDDKRYVNGINKDEPIDLAIAKASKRAEDARSNRGKAAKDPDIQDDKNYSYFISVEDLGIGKDGRIHGGSRNVQFGDEGFARETASNEEVRSGLFKKLKEYIQTFSKEGKMLVEKDQVWQENHPILAYGRSKAIKGAAVGTKKGISSIKRAFAGDERC